MIRSNSLTNEKIDNWLLSNNKPIKRIGNILGTHKNTLWRCLKENCEYEWNASPGNIKNKGSGCPKCVGNAKITNENIDEVLVLNNNINLLEIDGRKYRNNSLLTFLTKTLVMELS